MGKLTDRSFAPFVNLNSLIHIVNTGDTSQSLDGSSYKAPISYLAPFFSGSTDTFVTGGTYNNTTGIATFTNNAGGTFTVTGFLTGSTSGDSYWSASTGTNAIVVKFSNSVASGILAVGEGLQTTASGNYSHAEGIATKSLSEASHAEGYETTANGNHSHSEGFRTRAQGFSSHAEGASTTAQGNTSHAEGIATKSLAEATHAEGYETTANGNHSHSEGFRTTAQGFGSHAEGGYFFVSAPLFANIKGGYSMGDASHAEGIATRAQGIGSHAEGGFNSSTTIISGGTAIGNASHAEGALTTSIGVASHAEGILTTSTGEGSHSEGLSTTAIGNSSHSEGSSTTAQGSEAHAEGNNTKALNGQTHAEGDGTIASGLRSHAEGDRSVASGITSHAEGEQTTAGGNYSHSEGQNTKALGQNSHTANRGTIAVGDDQTAIGTFNITATTTNALFIIGNGIDNLSRSNAFRVALNGNVFNVGGTYTSGADYAEYFESINGLRYPYGTVVELDGDKIKVCENSENAIGVISVKPTMVGNSDEGTGDEWGGKYEKDIWGNYIMEGYEYEIQNGIDNEGKPTYITKNGFRRKLNPDYDKTLTYIPRSERPEWNIVGLMGQIKVLKNQNIPSRWIKMKDINDDIALYLIK
jgi:trimeric autotransporter adhesin